MKTIKGTIFEPIDAFMERHGLYHVFLGALLGYFAGNLDILHDQEKETPEPPTQQATLIEDLLGEDLTRARDIRIFQYTANGKPLYRITTPSDSTWYIIHEARGLIAVSEEDLPRHLWAGYENDYLWRK